MATHTPFEALVRTSGLEFRSIRANPRAMLDTPEGRALMHSGCNPVRIFLTIQRLARTVFETLSADAWAAARDASALLYTGWEVASPHIAQRLGVPSLPLLLPPMGLSRAEPLAGFPLALLAALPGNLQPPDAPVGRAGAVAPLPGHDQPLATGGPGPAAHGPHHEHRRRQEPIFYAFSPAVVARPPDWPAWRQVTGYWFLDRPDGWEPPERLRRFLEQGPPPVFIGFGSMTDDDPQRLAGLAVEALRQAGRRGILLSGWAGLDPAGLPDAVLVVEEVRFDWLLPPVAAVVHPGVARAVEIFQAHAGRPTAGAVEAATAPSSYA